MSLVYIATSDAELEWALKFYGQCGPCVSVLLCRRNIWSAFLAAIRK